VAYRVTSAEGAVKGIVTAWGYKFFCSPLFLKETGLFVLYISDILPYNGEKLSWGSRKAIDTSNRCVHLENLDWIIESS
jgi:hypothetical protein